VKVEVDINLADTLVMVVVTVVMVSCLYHLVMVAEEEALVDIVEMVDLVPTAVVDLMVVEVLAAVVLKVNLVLLQ
tara:strand:- start:493 stop:717 length:225 start_codon:yes stop_codon:yes gene_type:complete